MNNGDGSTAHLSLLCDPHHRAIHHILREEPGSLTVEELANRLVTAETGIVPSATYEEQVDETLITLHHQTLPKLAAADLVSYDSSANLVSVATPPAHAVEWHDSRDIDQVLSQLDGVPAMEPDSIGTLDGFEAVRDYGRMLADTATDEFFTLYATTDLLEEDCLGYGERLLERGVSLHIGSQNSQVRELTNEHLPGAIVWEPQLDWLNTPSYPRVGRLILADRERVVFSVLPEPPSADSTPTEIGLVGKGEDSPLVVLVRELLGARLDHLDYQTDDFRQSLTRLS